MSEFSISIVAVAFVDIIWEEVTPHIQRVVDVAHGELTMEGIHKSLMDGNSLLVTISKGSEIVAVNTFEIRVLSSGVRTIYISVTGGSELFKWKDDVVALAVKIAKKFKCTELRVVAVRDGWTDILTPMGWEHVHQVLKFNVEKDDGR